MTGAPLEVRAMTADEADLTAFKSCFERNGTERRVDALRWQYLENPTDELLVSLAMSDDTLAAIYAVQPARVRLEGSRRLAAQSVDTLVDSEFRGRGLFTTMADAGYRRTRDAGGAFVYGFPNGNSAPGFFGKLGWLSLDPVPFLVRPLRTAFLASKLPLGPLGKKLPDLRLPVGRYTPRANQELRALTELGQEIDSLWERFSREVLVAVDRSAEYLRWRLRKPGECYECLGLYEDDTLAAFCAFTTVDKHGGRIGYVVELLHEPGRPDVGATLLAEGLKRMAASGADAVLSWSFPHSPNRAAYSRLGFLPLPERLRPIELHVGVRPLDESLADLLGRRESWYLSYCDLDTV